MSGPALYLLLADLVLAVHFCFVAFVVVGCLAILFGPLAGWQWIYSRRFRWLHVAAIGVVVAQAWLGRLCPLTLWESALRRKAGEAGYDESFIQYWLQALLYYDFPPWVFTLAYTLFGAVVMALWWRDRRQLRR
jgi:hypothetical protein